MTRSRTRRCLRQSRRRSTGRRSTNAVLRPCATRPGTTGDPKVLRTAIARCILHSFAVWATFRLDDNGRLLIIVPMFHVNAWGTPYAGWLVGSDLLLPGRFLQPQGLCDFITQERPTFTGGVPTILTALLNHVQANGGDVSSIKTAVCGGSAVPATLIAAYKDVLGIELWQAWGMTETSPIAAIAFPPKGLRPRTRCTTERRRAWRAGR